MLEVLAVKGGGGSLILAGVMVAIIGWLLTKEIIDFLGFVIIIGGAVVGVFGLVKVFSGGSED